MENFQAWETYFKQHCEQSFNHFEWSADELSTAEKKLIAPSLQQFQCGESSEGNQWCILAQKLHDESYERTLPYFIREEQSHAAILQAFMMREQIPTTQNTSLDTLFRYIRHHTGLQGSVLSLMTAEIIASVYYCALMNATQSPNLKRICWQILKDEAVHLNFQCETLHILFQKSSFIKKLGSRLFHYTAIQGAMFVIWIQYRSLFKAGGFNFTRFVHAIADEFYTCEQKIIGTQPIQTPHTSLMENYLPL